MDDTALPFPEDAIEVGRIVGAFGIKGELKIKAFAADPQALFSSKRWFLRRPPSTLPGGLASPAGPAAVSHAAPRAGSKANAALPATPAAAPRRSTAGAAAAAQALLARQAPLPSPLRVQRAREQGEAVVATAHDITDRNAAEALVGCSIWISRASFPTPGVDEFYWIDLIGLAVANRQGVALGQVVDLIETGPSCVLRVVPGPARVAVHAAGTEAATAPPEPSADDILIPFVAAYVDAVDLPGRLITVDWQADY
jgi:16S rRNA processing protein RimM